MALHLQTKFIYDNCSTNNAVILSSLDMKLENNILWIDAKLLELIQLHWALFC
jgi:hypothetical protein